MAGAIEVRRGAFAQRRAVEDIELLVVAELRMERNAEQAAFIERFRQLDHFRTQIAERLFRQCAILVQKTDDSNLIADDETPRSVVEGEQVQWRSKPLCNQHEVKQQIRHAPRLGIFHQSSSIFACFTSFSALRSLTLLRTHPTIISMNALHDSMLDLIRRTSAEIPDDVQSAILASLEREKKGTIAESAMRIIEKNIDLAKQKSQPICQDTGSIIFYIDCPIGFDQMELEETLRN